MKHVLLLLIVAGVAALVVWTVLVVTERDEALPGAPGPAELVDEPARERIRSLEVEVERLLAEIDRMRSRPAPTRDREPAAPVPPPAQVEPLDRDPRWYLDRYVASFEGGGAGSEYFRLAVDAYALELCDPILAHVAESRRPLELRTSLIAMLGTPRFRGRWSAIGPLVGLVKREDEAAAASVRALLVIGDSSCGRSLEGFACWIRSTDLRRAVYATSVALADPEFDRALLRLLACADDEAEARYLLSLARGNDPEATLELFRAASGLDREVRLPAAERIGDFRTDPVRELTAAWHGTELDLEVRKRLERSMAKQSEKPPWCPEQAVGPPDAELSRDDARSWASMAADGGIEWLELAFAPRRANAVRVFEGLAGGALAEIHGRDTSGAWSLLWSGTQPEGTPGEWSTGFATTSRPIDRIKIVLDTRRTPGWNEIDAVELAGPDGRGWALAATASSYYGPGR